MLAVISDPQLFLKFDVIGKHIKGVSNKFQEYQSTIMVDSIGVNNTVIQVVWPAVVMKTEDKTN